jgi:hypothetical protein
MRRALPFLAAVRLMFVLLGVMPGVVPAQGDELRLKDGSTILGTIVAFEQNSFKVQTSYGFALVQRDQVAEIYMGDSVRKSAADKTPQPASAKPSATAVTAESAKTATAAAPLPANSPAPNNAESPLPPPPAVPMQNLQASAVAPAIPVISSSPNRSAPIAAPVVVKAVARSLAVPALPIAVRQPPKPAPPGPIREEVSGNVYRNDTFGFRMYKPPDWQVIPGARALLPGSITAMGTNDETTYLLIGQEPAGKSLAADIDATERRLSGIMDNFRANGEGHVLVSGIPAIERRFRGNVDQREWSGVVVCLPRDGQIFTIFGMTYAETDLVQIQENVLDRAIASIQFANP